jgi:hypothetical protein
MNAGHGRTSNQSLEEEGRRLVERLGGRWLGSGGMCRCPAHDDHTPSLSIRPGERRLLFHCFAGCETPAIILALRSLGLLAPTSPERGGGEPSPADPGRSNRCAAAALWAAARAIGRSPAEAYLKSRRLILPDSGLRYHPRTPLGRGPLAVFRPALLAAVRDESGLVAVHRTFLDLEPARLAGIAAPRRALGRPGQGAVRLRSPEDGVLGLAEGIETALAATVLTGISCWAALGNERLARIAIPPAVRRVILFLDNDLPGRRAGRLARKALERRGFAVETRLPARSGADWNDVLLDRATARADEEGREAADG